MAEGVAEEGGKVGRDIGVVDGRQGGQGLFEIWHDVDVEDVAMARLSLT